MAEVILRLGKGACGVSKERCNRSLLQIQRGHCESLFHVLSLSSRSLSCGFQSGQHVNSDNHRCYTTTRLPLPGRLGERDGFTKSHHELLGMSREGSLKFKRDRTVDRGLFDTHTLRRFARHTYLHRSKLRRTTPFSGAGFVHTFIFIRDYNQNGRRTEALCKTKTGYYNILEVSPEATQAQIKTAYYKQSFIYHPDKNLGSEEATARFADISEAYHVLGNKALRRKYDRGILTQSDLISVTTRSAAKDDGSQQTRTRHSVMGTHNQSTYDLDNFLKSYYGEQLQRDKDQRLRRMKMQKEKEADVSEMKLGKMKEMVVGALIAMALTIVLSLKG